MSWFLRVAVAITQFFVALVMANIYHYTRSRHNWHATRRIRRAERRAQRAEDRKDFDWLGDSDSDTPGVVSKTFPVQDFLSYKVAA